MKRLEKYTKWVTAFVFCVAVIAVYKTFDNIGNIKDYLALIIKAVSPFILGFVFAYILNMPAVRIEKSLKKIKNSKIIAHSSGISIFIVYLLSFLIVLVVIRAVVPAVYTNVLDLYANIPHYLEKTDEFINSSILSEKFGIQNYTFSLSQKINGFLSEFDISKFNQYAQGVYNITSGFVNVFISIIISVYMLLEKRRISRLIMRAAKCFINEKKFEYVVRLASDVNRVFINYIYSRLICCLIMAVICSAALSIMQVRYAIILGVFIGVCDMIPYFGSIISCVIASVVTLFTGGMWKAVLSAFVLLVLQQIDGNIMSPKIMGNSLEISPLLVIFAVVVGGSLFGFIGMLLSVPIITVLKQLAKEIIISRENKLAETAKETEDV